MCRFARLGGRCLIFAVGRVEFVMCVRRGIFHRLPWLIPVDIVSYLISASALLAGAAGTLLSVASLTGHSAKHQHTEGLGAGGWAAMRKAGCTSAVASG